ncbi:MAG: HesA/MoeB/ThiF family protein [Gemmataceae bacterium]|nr:HesA/MoeB/ThiF family protein [Gemmataceae bacterium]
MQSPLTPDDRARYEWQLSAAGFGEEGQARLRSSTVLISRIGGVGGTLAYELAAAGVGKLILAHAGNLRVDDLNRQLLMSDAGVDQSRVEQAARRLRAFNPSIHIETVAENVHEHNVDELVWRADAVASCAPLFAERLLMNRAAVRQGKPLVDCAMYEMEIQLLTVIPGQTPCLACLYPQEPPAWRRRFPVFGAVAGTAGCLGAMEIIKVLSGLDAPVAPSAGEARLDEPGLGEALRGRMLIGDLRTLKFRTMQLRRDPKCAVCAKHSK